MKKIVSTLLIVVAILGIASIQTVKAASIQFVATPNATTVNAEDTISINLKISDIDAGDQGINTLSCIFQYDEEIFEDVKVTSKNNWSITYNNEKDNEQYGTMLAMLLSAGVKDDQEIGVITLKVKKVAAGKTGNITFTQIASNDGQNEIPVANKTISIKVNGTSSSTQKPDDTNKPEDNKNNTINNNETNKELENTSTGKLPQTGYYQTTIIVALVVVTLFVIVTYVKYRKYKETK